MRVLVTWQVSKVLVLESTLIQHRRPVLMCSESAEGEHDELVLSGLFLAERAADEGVPTAWVAGVAHHEDDIVTRLNS